MSRSIKIFTLSTCSHCKATKRFLNELGVDYNFTDVDLLTGEDRKTAINEVRQYNPQVSFPTILIGDKVIVGNKENEIKEALGL
jgi:glutaredoxin-like protein NrdH